MSSTLPRYPNRIKECIHAAGYTIREIAGELRIPERTMRDYLTGRTCIPQDYLESLTALLGCSREGLLVTSPVESASWSVTYQRNPFFTGREEVLLQLSTALHKNGRGAIAQTYALCG